MKSLGKQPSAYFPLIAFRSDYASIHKSLDIRDEIVILNVVLSVHEEVLDHLWLNENEFNFVCWRVKIHKN